VFTFLGKYPGVKNLHTLHTGDGILVVFTVYKRFVMHGSDHTDLKII
jgi:hypothetical protein